MRSLLVGPAVALLGLSLRSRKEVEGGKKLSDAMFSAAEQAPRVRQVLVNTCDEPAAELSPRLPPPGIDRVHREVIAGASQVPSTSTIGIMH